MHPTKETAYLGLGGSIDALRATLYDLVLRDHYTEIAAEVGRTADEALRAAEETGLRYGDHRELRITEIDAGMDVEKRKEMIQRSGRTTYPQIFVGERHIGDLAKNSDLSRFIL